MKFRFALLAMAVSALVAGSVHAQTLRVTIRKAPVRSGPGSQEALVTTAMEGDVLEYVDVDGLWYIVRVPGTQQVGYIHSALVERTAQRAPAPAPPPQPWNDGPEIEPDPPPRPVQRETPPPAPRPMAPPRDPEPLPAAAPSRDPSREIPWRHRGFGAGIRMGHSTIGGVAFNFRSWKRGSMGFSFDLASELDVLQMQPSLMFKIGNPIETQAIYFQPYFGVGANTWWDRINDDFNVGAVVLGGTDIGFMAVPRLTVSIDLGYHSDAITGDCGGGCFTDNFSDRLGLNFGIDWYFK